MNLQEFSKLKVGDRIDNLSQGNDDTGEVVEMTPSGVRVVWGPRHEHETRFFYSVQSTAWMQWTKVDA